MSEIKQKALIGIFWSFCERFGVLFIQFVANIVLARLLTPDDYGVIGILLVFTTLSQVFIDAGFGAALIQKKNPSKEDYSTVFFINIIIAVLCYLVLFFSSDFISIYFEKPQLSILLQVIGIIVISDAFTTVQNNILIKTLNFKRIANIKIIVAVISSIASIIAAFNGLGIWSLVILYSLNSIIKTILMWVLSDWKPSLIFSKESFHKLFGFGSKLLLASLLSEGYRGLQSIIIGRHLSVRELGFFTQARQLENVPVSSIIAVVNQVTFPIFAQLQETKEQLNSALKRCFQLLGFINFPAMILLSIVAKPLFMFLYGEAWLESAPYFQGLCLGFGLLLVIHNTNLSILKAAGKSGIVLKLEIIKKFIGVILIFLLIHLGVMGLIIALAINSFIEFFINGYCTGKETGFGIKEQIKVLLPIFLHATIIGAIVYFIPSVIDLSNTLILLVQIIAYITLYLIGAYLVKMQIFNYIINEVREKIKR
ncbi:MAG: lipopolysaccharide biosynthesis protein [Bacteroidales bacterium]